jgi:hypothetical protein
VDLGHGGSIPFDVFEDMDADGGIERFVCEREAGGVEAQADVRTFLDVPRHVVQVTHLHESARKTVLRGDVEQPELVGEETRPIAEIQPVSPVAGLGVAARAIAVRPGPQ